MTRRKRQIALRVTGVCAFGLSIWLFIQFRSVHSSLNSSHERQSRVTYEDDRHDHTAQAGICTVTVRQGEDEQPILGAIVELNTRDGQVLSSTTGSDGRASFHIGSVLVNRVRVTSTARSPWEWRPSPHVIFGSMASLGVSLSPSTRLAGGVFDNTTARPISNAIVTASTCNSASEHGFLEEAVTDAGGAFEFRDAPLGCLENGGMLRLSVTSPLFRDAVVWIDTRDPSAMSKQLSIYLEPDRSKAHR